MTERHIKKKNRTLSF